MKISTTLFFSLVGISAASSAAFLVYYPTNKIPVPSIAIKCNPSSDNTGDKDNYPLFLENFPT